MQNEMRDRLVELINNYPCMSTAKDFSLESIDTDLADYLIASGVIVPPCKVGDTIYLLQKYYGTYCFNIVEDKAQMIGITSRGIHIKARNHHDHNKMYMLGKTVFLTKEEAEQKLKGGADNGNL